MRKYLILAGAMCIIGAQIAYAAGYDFSLIRIEDETAETASALDSTYLVPLYDTTAGDADLLAVTDIPGIGAGATNAEIDRIADDSGRLVDIAAGAQSFTCAANGTGLINIIDNATDTTVTLPAATGSGCVYEVRWQSLPAASGQSGDVVQVTGDDEFRGVLGTLSDDAAGLKGWALAGGSDNDKLTFTSSTKFVATKGVAIKFKDVAADVYHVEGMGSSTGTEATPAATGQRS